MGVWAGRNGVAGWLASFFVYFIFFILLLKPLVSFSRRAIFEVVEICSSSSVVPVWVLRLRCWHTGSESANVSGFLCGWCWLYCIIGYRELLAVRYTSINL